MAKTLNFQKLAAQVREQQSHASPLAKLYGHGPTVIVAGMSASGKTSLINLMLGARILAEGSGHTTTVPTIICRGDEFDIKVLDAHGEPLPDAPDFPSPPQLSASLPDNDDDWRLRMTTNDRMPHAREQKAYWDAINELARQGQCTAIDIRVPAQWIPPGIRFVDIPGYESWDPSDDQSSQLKQVILSWFYEADHALFVTSHAHFQHGHGVEFIRDFLERNRLGASLIINQVDEAFASDPSTTIAAIIGRHTHLLTNDYQITNDNITMMAICAHPRRLSVIPNDEQRIIYDSLKRLGQLLVEAQDALYASSAKRWQDAEAQLLKQRKKAFKNDFVQVEASFRTKMEQKIEDAKVKWLRKMSRIPGKIRRTIDQFDGDIRKTDQAERCVASVQYAVTQRSSEIWDNLCQDIKAKAKRQLRSCLKEFVDVPTFSVDVFTQSLSIENALPELHAPVGFFERLWRKMPFTNDTDKRGELKDALAQYFHKDQREHMWLQHCSPILDVFVDMNVDGARKILLAHLAANHIEKSTKKKDRNRSPLGHQSVMHIIESRPIELAGCKGTRYWIKHPFVFSVTGLPASFAPAPRFR